MLGKRCWIRSWLEEIKTNPAIETVIQEEASHSPVEETESEVPVVSSHDFRIRPLSSSPLDYDYADYERKVSMSVFDAENKVW